VFTYMVDVHHRDRYSLTATTAAEAIKIAQNCAVDNYGNAYLYDATFDVVRVDIPQAGDLTDAGLAGE